MIREIYNTTEFEQAETRRKEDLLLYFSMELFGKRKTYSRQPEALKRDIKGFFNDYHIAIKFAENLLFSIADTLLIREQCEKAHSILPASLLNKGHSLILHRDYLNELPLLLRVYVGAGLQIYGDLDEHIDLIKIHITSGKLTLTAYDDFRKSVPFLTERVKIKMADQDIDFFDYTEESKRPPLLNKHLLIDSKHKDYERQMSFNRKLSKLLNINDKEEVIFNRHEYDDLLNISEKKVKGFTIVRR